MTDRTDRTDRIDRRVRRTRSALRAAVLQLAGEVSLADLSVARVASEAGVSRQTFYAHYADLDELAVVALRDELEDLRAISRETGELTADATDPASPPPGLVRLTRFLDEHRFLLVRALGPEGSPGFAHWLRELIAADVVEGLRRRPDRVHDEVPLPVQARFVAGALLGALLPTVAEAPPADPDDTANTANTADTADPADLALQVWTLLRPVFGVARVTTARDG